MNDIVSKIEKSLKECWATPGSVSFNSRCRDDIFNISISPAVRETVGGAEDGSQSYPPFAMELNKFIVQVFDKCPKITLTGQNGDDVPYLHFRGKIGGQLCNVIVLTRPHNTQQVAEIFYAYGPKAGTVENK